MGVVRWAREALYGWDSNFWYVASEAAETKQATNIRGPLRIALSAGPWSYFREAISADLRDPGMVRPWATQFRFQSSALCSVRFSLLFSNQRGVDKRRGSMDEMVVKRILNHSLFDTWTPFVYPDRDAAPKRRRNGV